MPPASPGHINRLSKNGRRTPEDSEMDDMVSTQPENQNLLLPGPNQVYLYGGDVDRGKSSPESEDVDDENSDSASHPILDLNFSGKGLHRVELKSPSSARGNNLD